MSFFHKKMSQNLWATIMPFGPGTLIFYWPKKFCSGQPKAGLISGTVVFLTSVFRVSNLHLELSISIPVFFSESHILATSPDEYWTHQKFQKYLQDSSN